MCQMLKKKFNWSTFLLYIAHWHSSIHINIKKMTNKSALLVSFNPFQFSLILYPVAQHCFWLQEHCFCFCVLHNYLQLNQVPKWTFWMLILLAQLSGTKQPRAYRHMCNLQKMGCIIPQKGQNYYKTSKWQKQTILPTTLAHKIKARLTKFDSKTT